MPKTNKVVPKPPERVEAKKLTARIRTKRDQVKASKAEATTGTNAAQIAQLQRHVNQLQGLALAQGRLLALLTDPVAADLTDDDA